MIIPQGYAQVTAGFGGPGVPTGAACTFGILWGPPSDPDASLSLISTAVEDLHFQLATSTVQLQSVEIKAGPNATGQSIGLTMGTNGGNGNSNEQPNTAWLLKKRTALGGRHGQGRCFWPGVGEAHAGNDGAILPTPLTAAQSACNAFMEALDQAAHPMYLLHSDAVAPTLVTSFIVDGRTATQRNRLRR